MSDLEQRIAGILGEHRWDKTETVVEFGCRCECGEPICTPDGGQSHDWHFRAHLAAVLAAAVRDHITQARAEAWDEGYSWCFGEHEGVRSLDDNPYRADRIASTKSPKKQHGNKGRTW